MHLLAVIDATGSRAPRGPATVVAGLTVIERAIRLASVCGADEIVVWIPADHDFAISHNHPLPSGLNLTVCTANDDHSLTSPPDGLVVLNAEAVYDRSFVARSVESIRSMAPAKSSRDGKSLLFVGRFDEPPSRLNLTDIRRIQNSARPGLSGGWAVAIDSGQAADRAARRLWNSCRKAEDGLVARHLNRHVSIALSKQLAPLAIRPNHITAMTFALGIAAAMAAAYGEYLGFLIAGLLYQANSVLDGVDGELARVRYEFSLLGEWLDTISDDLADLLMYLGLGIGAWRTMGDAPGPWGAELWLLLGSTAAVAKILTMAVYYRWLIARGRGDLLAFEWSFEEDGSDDDALARFLSMTRYFFRKDFIVFAAMIASIGGVLPHLLFVLAPGNAIVAISVVIQNFTDRHVPDS